MTRLDKKDTCVCGTSRPLLILSPPIQSQFSLVLLRSAPSRSFHFFNEHLASVQLSSHLLILVRLSTVQFTLYYGFWMDRTLQSTVFRYRQHKIGVRLLKERLKTDCRVLFLLKYSCQSLRGFHYRKHRNSFLSYLYWLIGRITMACVSNESLFCVCFLK